MRVEFALRGFRTNMKIETGNRELINVDKLKFYTIRVPTPYALNLYKMIYNYTYEYVIVFPFLPTVGLLKSIVDKLKFSTTYKYKFFCIVFESMKYLYFFCLNISIFFFIWIVSSPRVHGI